MKRYTHLHSFFWLLSWPSPMATVHKVVISRSRIRIFVQNAWTCIRYVLCNNRSSNDLKLGVKSTAINFCRIRLIDIFCARFNPVHFDMDWLQLQAGSGPFSVPCRCVGLLFAFKQAKSRIEQACFVESFTITRVGYCVFYSPSSKLFVSIWQSVTFNQTVTLGPL